MSPRQPCAQGWVGPRAGEAVRSCNTSPIKQCIHVQGKTNLGSVSMYTYMYWLEAAISAMNVCYLGWFLWTLGKLLLCIPICRLWETTLCCFHGQKLENLLTMPTNTTGLTNLTSYSYWSALWPYKSLEQNQCNNILIDILRVPKLQ
jgi:hypothetical protein